MNEEVEESQQQEEQEVEEEVQQQEDRPTKEEELKNEEEEVQQEDLQEKEKEEEEKVEAEEMQQEEEVQCEGEVQQEEGEVQQQTEDEQELEEVQQEEEVQCEEVQQDQGEEQQEETVQQEEAQTEEMLQTVEQQTLVQQQTEEVQQQQTDFVDPLEQSHNNQVLIRLRGMRLLDTEDELSDLQAESVPREVRDWLACTFTRKMGVAKRRPEEKPRFRSIVHAVQAGIFVERMYRRTSTMAGLTYPPTALTALKEVDQWSFDVFSFHEATGDHALKFLVYDLLTRYDLVNRFRHWLSELEILAMVFAAAIHDFEHTGTTNNFHIHARSEVAIFYNDRSVLENHHISAAYRLMAEEDMNILGDKEVELGLPFSPLCDRKATMIAQSQIGFIDFIVEPTFSVLIDTTEKVIGPLIDEDRKARESGNRKSRYCHYCQSPTDSRLWFRSVHDSELCSSLTGSGSVTVESVQRHSSELANKEQEEQEKAESNSDVQSDGHTSDQSQDSDGSPPDETHDDASPEDHLTCNAAHEDRNPDNQTHPGCTAHEPPAEGGSQRLNQKSTEPIPLALTGSNWFRLVPTCSDWELVQTGSNWFQLVLTGLELVLTANFFRLVPTGSDWELVPTGSDWELVPTRSDWF
ncbi:hypothetical protein F2P81_021711 [Scophthalmus maximus]|uniref:Phosphodiesterase n=1 Tax=Scophthalmus maximus TaxID=52904 RepID=A0A6A4S8M5_SCOMX|nr:hypothetical protein F2P81_021711 [Scophthalmus maximus]